MMKILFVDACPRDRSVSRSYRLGKAFLDAVLRLHPDAEVESIRLNDLNLQPLTGEAEAERSRMIDAGRQDALTLAQSFAHADRIVICAPYWDFMFPAMLKTYIEHVCVRTVTFIYQNDLPVGLCRAKDLIFLTTSGSPMMGCNWGGEYLSSVTRGLLGVQAFHQISAEGLDTADADPEAILARSIEQAETLAKHLG